MESAQLHRFSGQYLFWHVPGDHDKHLVSHSVYQRDMKPSQKDYTQEVCVYLTHLHTLRHSHIQIEVLH